MARSRASPDWIEALRKSDEVGLVVDALALAERFYFAIVVCASPAVADAVLDALVDRVSAERGSKVRLVRLDPYEGYESPGDAIPFPRVVRRVLEPLVAPAPENRSAEVVFVVDASHALPHDYAWGTMFQRMNERRNTIVQGLAGPLLLCVPPWLEPVFARNAPDFWSIRSLAVVVKATAPAEAPEAAAKAVELPREGLLEIHAAAVKLGLDRGALLSGIDPSFVALFASGGSAAGQLLLDLQAMNGVRRLADGTVPLQTWLRNAVALAGYRFEAEVFRQWLSVMTGEVRRLAPRVSIARLPATSGVLFGREEELAWLDRCWDEGVHVACVVAFGGVGKSALVNTWLSRMDEAGWRGAGRVYAWSFYSQGTDRLGSSDEFIAKALEDLGDPDPARGSPWDKGERLAALVRREPTILILDGIEPMQWGPGVQEGRLKDPALEALVKELAAENSGLCVITSRIAVTDLVGEYKVGSKDLGNLSPETGATLLRSRGVKGTDAELEEASREYKGHGLALTLLGSYLADAVEGDIRRRREIGPLEQDEREGARARRVMAAYERWLGKPEVAVLHIMGLFDRPADEGEIAAVLAEPVIPGLTDALADVTGRAWNKVVARLRKAGLLLPDEEDKKLDAHPLVREHFGQQLRREQPGAWREGHRRLYEHLREMAKDLPETVEEMAPLYEAVVHGCLAEKNQEAIDEVYRKRILRGAEHFSWHKLGTFGSEIAALSAFFDPPWERLVPGLTDGTQAFVLNETGFVLRALGRLAEGAGLMRLALEMSTAQQDWLGASVSGSNLSEILQARGELSEALAPALKSVELADKSGDVVRRVLTRTTLATGLHAMGRWDEAAAQFEEAERVQRKGQPTHPQLYALRGYRYCDLLLDEGRDADARERAAQALRWGGTRYPLLDMALDYLSIGRAHLLAVQRGAEGHLAEAASHLVGAVRGLYRAGQQDYLPLGLLARAALHTHTRAFSRARRDLDAALTIATRCGFRLHEADAHLGHTRLALAEGDPATAREHLAAARALVAATGYHRRDAELAELEALVSQAPSGAAPAPPSTTPMPTAAPVAEKASPTPIKLFYSYSHEDEALRKELESYLALLKRQGHIEDWHDREIGAGTEWAGAIDDNLARADIVLLLVSADFLASDYGYDKEVARALQRSDAGEALVIPVVLRPCDWSGAPFARLQALPKDAKPVTKWKRRDDAWADVARGIRRAVEDLRKRRAGAAGPGARPRH